MITYSNKKNIEIENARIMFRNFSGEKKKFNDEGDRNFCVEISNPEDAEMLRREGWNIKTWNRDEDEEPLDYMKVKVMYGKIPPAIHRKCGKKTVLLNEDSVDILDSDEIESVDLVIRPFEYDVNGHTGIAAYIKVMYVTVSSDPFAYKYDDEDVEPFH